MLELNGSAPVELQEREEARHDNSTRRDILDELMERHAPRLGEHRRDEQSLLAHGDNRIVQVGDLNRRARRRQSVRGQTRQILRGCEPPKLGQEGRKMRLEGHVPGNVRTELPHPSIDVLCRFLESPILQEPREQEIAGLQVGLGGVVLLVDTGQQMRGLHVQEGRRDDQEFRRTRQVRGRLHERDELVGHLRERDLGDVEFLARNQRQKKIERTFKNRE